MCVVCYPLYAGAMSTTAPLSHSPAGDPAFTIGDRIRTQRRKLGLDQEDVAHSIGVSRPLVSKWERDVSIPDVEQAKALAVVLDCSFGWLCGVPARSRCSSASDLVDGLDAIAHSTKQIPGQRQFAIAS